MAYRLCIRPQRGPSQNLPSDISAPIAINAMAAARLIHSRGNRTEARPAPYSVQVEAVEIHHLGPGLHKVPHELLFSVSRSINLRNGAQLGVRPEHQVNRGG